jgi:hypothetical protein
MSVPVVLAPPVTGATMPIFISSAASPGVSPGFSTQPASNTEITNTVNKIPYLYFLFMFYLIPPTVSKYRNYLKFSILSF